MCPMTLTAGAIGLLASLPLVGGLFAFLPKLGIRRATARPSAGPPPATTAEVPERSGRLELELLRAQREIRELREQLTWQAPLPDPQRAPAADEREVVLAR